MRSLFLLATVFLAMIVLSSTTPINFKRLLINRPTEGPYDRLRRAAPDVKGQPPGIVRVPLSRQELNLRKGEYICEGKVCRLRPGEVPEHCVHCQYAV